MSRMTNLTTLPPDIIDAILQNVNPTEHVGTGEKNPTSELVGFSVLVELGGFEPPADPNVDASYTNSV
ncbi:MAG: hypothetical protein ABI343_17325 [Burkholderiaceae bacterium]